MVTIKLRLEPPEFEPGEAGLKADPALPSALSQANAAFVVTILMCKNKTSLSQIINTGLSKCFSANGKTKR